MEFTVYDSGTGEIVKFGHCADDDVLLQVIPGQQVITNMKVPDDTHYIVGGSPELRPVLDVQAEYFVPADGATTVTFALPAGSKIIYEATEEEWSDEDSFAMSADAPGDHAYTILPPFPWRRPVRVVIHAS